MAMGKRPREQQRPLWVSHQDLPRPKGHPFYEGLNQLLGAHGFDDAAEVICRPFYADKMGRPSLAPGVYFRCLLIGYFEGIDSERGIAWRCADSLSLRTFLGVGLGQAPPDHSTRSRARRLIDLETHRRVFNWVLKVIACHGLLRGKTAGIDATTLEANAALRSIVRRDTGESYQQFLERLAVASGIETPTREDLAKLDKKRKNKGSNDDWQHPHDPDARITKMKDGRTHLAHKMEHAVDFDSGAAIAVTVQGADRGDTTTFRQTVVRACENLQAVKGDPATAEKVNDVPVEEAVLDKGYHSNEVCRELREAQVRSYIAEPDRGRRNWEGKHAERDAVYANRRRIRGKRGKALMRQRGELLERGFAHELETGGMRRTHLRGHENILKRLLIHVGGFNPGLLMRKLIGKGTPRGRQDRCAAVLALLQRLWTLLEALIGCLPRFIGHGRIEAALRDNPFESAAT